MKEKFLYVITAVWLTIVVIIVLMLMVSCNVTRIVTTEAAHYQRGDTTVTIITKTTESYDASKK